MREKKRIPSRLLASLVFVALTGFAVSCGEQQSSSETEAPPKEAESAQKAPETSKAEEKTEKVEKTEAEKTEAEKPEPKKVEEPKAEQLPAGAGEVAEAAGDQYGAETARQYEEPQYEDSQYEESQDENEELVANAPSDTTMSLSVPALGISGTPVIDENSEAALTAGTMHLPGTGFPWLEGSNTYIAGHRVGYPGTPSDRIFYDLPSISMGDEVTLTDANGETYSYAVSEIFAVTPFDTWVTGPTGEDTVTLQVCTETPDDWFTIGPRLMSSGPESGRLIVRAARV
ncbi:MAG: sortase [Actinomycetota bacterium]|nr:sortase [Actinomycetota bacterium]